MASGWHLQLVWLRYFRFIFTVDVDLMIHQQFMGGELCWYVRVVNSSSRPSYFRGLTILLPTRFPRRKRLVLTQDLLCVEYMVWMKESTSTWTVCLEVDAQAHSGAHNIQSMSESVAKSNLLRVFACLTQGRQR